MVTLFLFLLLVVVVGPLKNQVITELDLREKRQELVEYALTSLLSLHGILRLEFLPCVITSIREIRLTAPR